MARFLRHVPQQMRSLGATLRLLTSSQVASRGDAVGQRFSSELPAPPAGLLDDFVRYLGGDPGSYRGVVPPHFFCQWTFGSLLEAAATLPYPPLKVVNVGCGFRVNSPLPRGEPLAVETVIESAEDDGYRAKIVFKLTTSTPSSPGALESWVTARVLLKRKKSEGPRAPAKTVPVEARKLRHLRFRSNAGAEFARLTGDFNPLHYNDAYARTVGFRSKILHGFASFGFCVEGLNRALLSGAAGRLVSVQSDFRRPVLLPGDANLLLANVRGAEALSSNVVSPSGSPQSKGDFFLAPAARTISYLEGQATWMSY